MADRKEDVSSPAMLVPLNGADATSDERLVALWKAHYGDLLAYARRRVPDDAAGDVVSAVFTVLWRRIDEPLDDPLPWLYAVARREVANHRRGSRRRRAMVVRVSGGRAVSSADIPDIADHAVDCSMARAALARLRPADREILMLVAWEGLEPQRAAAALGVSPATFAVRLHRARRRLEAHLSATAEESTP